MSRYIGLAEIVKNKKHRQYKLPSRHDKYERVRLFVCVRVCGAELCLSVCPRTYVRNYMSDLYHILCMSSMTVALSSSDGVSILCMYFRFMEKTSYLHIMGHIWRHVDTVVANDISNCIDCKQVNCFLVKSARCLD